MLQNVNGTGDSNVSIIRLRKTNACLLLCAQSSLRKGSDDGSMRWDACEQKIFHRCMKTLQYQEKKEKKLPRGWGK